MSGGYLAVGNGSDWAMCFSAPSRLVQGCDMAAGFQVFQEGNPQCENIIHISAFGIFANVPQRPKQDTGHLRFKGWREDSSPDRNMNTLCKDIDSKKGRICGCICKQPLSPLQFLSRCLSYLISCKAINMEYLSHWSRVP